jgi:hypothetical protein
MERIDCPYIDREDQVLSYLSNKLPPKEAEAFERHYFECDRCWHEVQRALELRAAIARASARPVTVVPTRTTRAMPWRWLAAAAMVVFGLSLWQFAFRTQSPGQPIASQPSPSVTAPVAPTPSASEPAAKPAPQSVQSEPVLRSPSGATLLPRATTDTNGGMRIEWTGHNRAARYILNVFAQDGTPVASRQSNEAAITLEPAVFAKRRINERLFARVDAVDALGVVIGSSPRTTLPPRKREYP